uniref:HA n=1 Tax=Bemisia tabaci Quaranja-like virus 1 TaxID=2840014 RepID=A0A8E8FVE3_9ORTO|nr:HA [Bemisia tabaci Quaranja-like virus 1]
MASKVYIKMSILLLWCLSMDLTSSSSPCLDTACVGPYRFKRYKEPVRHSTVNLITGIADIFNRNMEMIVVEKVKFTRYCYGGLIFGMLEDCESGYEYPTVTESEFKSKKCLVTDVPSTCFGWTGKDSDNCNSVLTLKEVEKHEFKCINESQPTTMLRHSCVIDWKCNVKIAQATPYITPAGKVTTYDKKGNIIEIGDLNMQENAYNENSYLPISKVVNVDDGFTAQFNYHPTSKRCELAMGCFKNGDQRICAVKESECPELVGNTYLFKTEVYLKENVKITLSDSKYCDNKTQENVCKTTGQVRGKNFLSLKGASIEDVQVVTNELHFMHEETNFNVEVLNSKINHIYNLFITMMESSSKVDDELIPKILGQSSKVKWLNSIYFNICPCYDPKISDHSNCGNGFIFKNGRIERKEPNDQCFKLSEKTAKEIDIDILEAIEVTDLNFPPPEGLPADWEGWTWVSENKETLTKIKTSTVNLASEKVQSILERVSTMSFNPLSYFAFVTTSSFAAYVALAISVFLLIRK